MPFAVKVWLCARWGPRRAGEREIRSSRHHEPAGAAAVVVAAVVLEELLHPRADVVHPGRGFDDPRTPHELGVLRVGDRGQDSEDHDGDQKLDQRETAAPDGAFGCGAARDRRRPESWTSPRLRRRCYGNAQFRTTKTRSKAGRREQAAGAAMGGDSPLTNGVSARFTGRVRQCVRCAHGRRLPALRDTRASPSCRPRSCPSAAHR